MWTATVQQDPDSDDMFLILPPDLLEKQGWTENDELRWTDNKDGTFSLSKVEKTETQWVLVETVSIFKLQYMIETPVGKSDWALDTVTMNEAKEFSQEHLDEIITNSRIVTKEEALELCDKSNDYISSWNERAKVDAFFTHMSDIEKD